MVLRLHKKKTIFQNLPMLIYQPGNTTGAATDQQHEQQDKQGRQPHGRGPATANNCHKQHKL